MHFLKESGKDFKKDLENISKHFQNFCRKYDVSLAEAIALLGQSRQNQKKNFLGKISVEKTIPLEIFLIEELGYFESLVRYLKDIRNISIKDQSAILNRSVGALWASYYSSNKKYKTAFDQSMMQSLSEKLVLRLTDVRPDLVQKKDLFRIPLDLISGRKLSPFQSVVIFLRTYFNLRFIDISEILGKDMHSVWNAANSAKLESIPEDAVVEVLDVSNQNKEYDPSESEEYQSDKEKKR